MRLRSGLYGGWLSISQPYSWKTVVTNVAICEQVLLQRMITWSSVCERICQTSGLKILRRKCTFTCWSHCATAWHHVFGELHQYNRKPLLSFVSPSQLGIGIFVASVNFFPVTPYSETSILVRSHTPRFHR